MNLFKKLFLTKYCIWFFMAVEEDLEDICVELKIVVLVFILGKIKFINLHKDMDFFSLSDFSQFHALLMDTTDVNAVNSAAKLVLSVVLGSIIGYERKSKGQVAGVGTFALISAGATLAMILSIYIPQEFAGDGRGDPGRIAAQVIAGIGFLGAGAIIRMKGSIKGVTTAAGIWLAAMIGMAVGAGMYVVAVIAMILMLIVLVYFSSYEQHVNIGWKNKTIRIECRTGVIDTEKFTQILKEQGVKISDTFLKQDFEAGMVVLSFIVMIKSNTNLINLFKAIHESDVSVTTVTLDSDFNL